MTITKDPPVNFAIPYPSRPREIFTGCQGKMTSRLPKISGKHGKKNRLEADKKRVETGDKRLAAAQK